MEVGYISSIGKTCKTRALIARRKMWHKVKVLAVWAFVLAILTIGLYYQGVACLQYGYCG